MLDGSSREETTKNRIIRPSLVQIEQELEVLARWMDNQFQIPLLGWRFGLNAIIDLLPGIGDTATSLVAVYILASAVRYRVPKITLLRMGINIAIYFIVGLVPWVGDLFGAWWKPNIRNISLLRKRATVSAGEAKRGKAGDWWFVGGIILVLATVVALSAAASIYLFIQIIRQLANAPGM